MSAMRSYGQAKYEGIFIGNSSHRITDRDTIPCILLICDTAKRYDTYNSENNHVYWIKGFVVKEYKGENYYKIDKVVPIFEPVEYLDKWKHPLDKSIIVWQTQ
jgi:hypothetical protein